MQVRVPTSQKQDVGHSHLLMLSVLVPAPSGFIRIFREIVQQIKERP